MSIRSVTGDRATAAECLTYAEAILDKAGLLIDRFSSNGFESLVATTRRTKSPMVLLQAHLDVVPGPARLFKLRGEGPRLVGRGAYDMKYAAACFLHMVEEMGQACARYDFGIMLTTDEETDGRNGVGYLLDQGYSCKMCLLPDGGDNWRIESRAKGLWQVEARASGRSAHGSRPWEGDNAAVRLMQFALQAEALAPLGSHTDTTLVTTRLNAGKAYNQVPDSATATFDIRFLTMEDYTQTEKRLRALADEHDVRLIDVSRAAPVELDVMLPLVKEWERIVAEVRGSDAPDGYALSFGASDARYFADVGIPTILTRPEGGGLHGSDEWIDEGGLYQFSDCIRRYIQAVTALDATLAPVDA
ncbi:MAG TPA: M20/M25/M40 family metallo-hydrolase [Candidatus Saccharimonadales bacterium]